MTNVTDRREVTLVIERGTDAFCFSHPSHFVVPSNAEVLPTLLFFHLRSVSTARIGCGFGSGASFHFRCRTADWIFWTAAAAAAAGQTNMSKSVPSRTKLGGAHYPPCRVPPFSRDFVSCKIQCLIEEEPATCVSLLVRSRRRRCSPSTTSASRPLTRRP